MAFLRGRIELHLRAVRQFARDVVQHVRGRGRRAGVRDRRIDIFDDGQIHVGGGQGKPIFGRAQADIGQNRYRIAPFHHALAVGQTFEKGSPVNDNFHLQISTDMLRLDRSAPQRSARCANRPIRELL